MHHNIEPYDRRYKSLVLNFFVTDILKQLPLTSLNDLVTKSTKNYILNLIVFSLCVKTQFILITGIKSRKKLALSEEIKSPGNEADVHVHVAYSFSFNCLSTFIWMLPVHSIFSFYDANARTHLFNISNVWEFHRHKTSMH